MFINALSQVFQVSMIHHKIMKKIIIDVKYPFFSI